MRRGVIHRKSLEDCIELHVVNSRWGESTKPRDHEKQWSAISFPSRDEDGQTLCYYRQEIRTTTETKDPAQR